MNCVYTNIKSMLCAVKENINRGNLWEALGKIEPKMPHGKKMTPDRASAYGQESCVRLGLYHQ